MVTQIEDSKLGYLVVVPSAEHLGPTLEEKVGGVLQLDALSCQVVCDDADYPDPLQNALKRRPGPASRSERIREGMRAKAAQGLGLGKPPYGYRIGPDGMFSPVEAEAEVVKSMFERYAAEGGGVRTIASWLNDSGRRTRRGLRWSMVTVRDILRNSAYIGTYRRFGLRIPGTYQPIVTPGLFREVQERMQVRSPVRRNPKAEPFLLSGILYCGHCGQRMMGVTRRQTWRRKDGERARAEYRYYQCQSRINRSQCDYRTTKAPDLEEAVLDRLRRGDGSGHEAGPVGEPAQDAPDGEDFAEWSTARRAQLNARLSSVGKRYAGIVERAASGALTLAQLRVVTLEAQAAERSLREQLVLLEGGEAGMRAMVDASRDKLCYRWDDLDVGERQEVLRTLVAKVILKDGQVEVVPS
jgi:site-specific DNA recombinase